MLVMISMLSLLQYPGPRAGLHGDGEGEQDDLGPLHSEHLAHLSEPEVLCRPYCEEVALRSWYSLC